MSRCLHVRNTGVHSITKNSLCFVCHSKPDIYQEDFNCGCCCPDNSFFCVKVNMHVSKAKYVKTHTERHYQHGYLYYQNMSHSTSNHGEGVALRKLIGHMH